MRTTTADTTGTTAGQYFEPRQGGHDYSGLPLDVIARKIPAIQPDTAIGSLLQGFSEYPEMPVVARNRRLIGMVRENDVLIASGTFVPASQSLYTLGKNDHVRDADEIFNRSEQLFVPIVDETGRYTGQCASRQQWLRLKAGLLRPTRVGGLATPFGVYLTSGYYMAGAGMKGLLATGALFAVLVQGLNWLSVEGMIALFNAYPPMMQWPDFSLILLQIFFMLFGLLAVLRFSPMAGLHAAEHMTICAIEGDLPVTENTVRHQPRVHPRCGTNIMVLLLGLQVAVMSLFAVGPYLNWLGAFLYAWFTLYLVFKFWLPAGLWLQDYFTTRRPYAWELRSGLKAGQELLEKFRANPHPQPSVWRKLWGSGLPHMLVSFLVTSWLIEQLIARF